MKLVLLLALSLGCMPKPPKPGPVEPLLDAAINNTATCEEWCARARQLGCPSAKPTPNGASCEVVCLNVQDSKIVSWDLGCRVRASTCAAAAKCD